MKELTHHKVTELPSVLDPNAIYYVKNGDEFDEYITSDVGTMITATPQNKVAVFQTRGEAENGTISQRALTDELIAIDDELDNKVDKEVGKGLSTNDFTDEDKAKLDSATTGTTDEFLLDRGNHTGVQPIATVDGLQLALGELESDVSGLSTGKVDKDGSKQLSDENFTQAEKEKLTDIAPEATKNRDDDENADKVHTHTADQVTGLDTALDNKVDKVTGKDLSDTNFTQAEKDKLSSLEGSKFVGLFVSESALPATGSDGDYANVDGGVGSDVYRVLWDSSDGKWAKMQGVSTDLTPAQIKQQYEGNPDTNAFTDDEKAKLTNVASGATANRADTLNADKVHTHPWAEVTGQPATATRWPTFDDVTGKPTNYATTWDSVASKPATATRWPTVAEVGAAPASHTHDYFPLGGGTLSGATRILMNTSSPTYSNSHLELQSSDGSDVSMSFHRGGHTACQLRHSDNGLILSGTSRDTAADFYCHGNITAYSDLRLKKDLKIIESPIDKVMRLNGYTYVRTNDVSEARQTGVVAQEVLKVLPEAVIGGPTENDPDGHYSVAYGNMVGLLIEAIKEQSKEMDILKEEINKLKERL